MCSGSNRAKRYASIKKPRPPILLMDRLHFFEIRMVLCAWTGHLRLMAQESRGLPNHFAVKGGVASDLGSFGAARGHSASANRLPERIIFRS